MINLIGVNDIDFEQTLVGLFDKIPFYVFLIDEDHNIVFANKAVWWNFGKNPEAVIGKHCPRLIHDVDEYTHCPVIKAIEKNAFVEIKYQDENSKKWFLNTAYPTTFVTEEGKRVFFHFNREIIE